MGSDPDHIPGISFFRIENELSQILGCKVDLDTPQSLSRYFGNHVVAQAEFQYSIRRSTASLHHMLDHAREAVAIVQGTTRGDLPALIKTSNHLMEDQTYLEAIRAALHEEMSRESSVYVFGEDVTLGGPFGVTKGLEQDFGAGRVVNTPISEGTVMGLAIGAATAGLRPVVEIMFIDFITLALDQLVNHAAKLHYMSGGQLKIPLTVRVQCGISGAMGAHHSQSLEAWLAHVPGLKVVMPSNPADAKGLLKTAIRDDNPVVFIEHRGLYWGRGKVPDGDHVVPIGKAAVLRHGEQVTIVAMANMVGAALAAADELAGGGISAEVIDPRSISPLDTECIVQSVKKTSRLIIVHEAVEQGGVGAEIAAAVQQHALYYLDGPILRIAAPFAPVPASPSLEKRFLPAQIRIVEAARKLTGSP